jgi:hypothetical protein
VLIQGCDASFPTWALGRATTVHVINLDGNSSTVTFQAGLASPEEQSIPEFSRAPSTYARQWAGFPVSIKCTKGTVVVWTT